MAKKLVKSTKVVSTPVLVVSQWLSYVLWALAITAIAYVTSTIIGFYSDVTTTLPAELVAYGVVAIAILLPLALIADIFYGKYEDERKTTATSVVMVIHAVLFALVAVGALIVTAFYSINPLFSTTPNPTAVVDIATAATVFVLFVILLIRVAKPRLYRFLRPIFRTKFIVIGVVVVGFAIAGPLSYAVITKNDRLTRDAVVYASSALNAYVSQGNDLPANIDSNLGSGDGMYPYGYGQESIHKESIRLQKEGVITYTPNTQPVETLKDEFSTGNKKVYYYELCATYQHALRKDPTMSYVTPADSNGYTDYLTIDSVESGKQCYKLKTTRYLVN